MRKLEKQTRFLCCVYGAVTLALGAACAACAYVGWQVFGAPAFAAAAAIFAAAALPPRKPDGHKGDFGLEPGQTAEVETPLSPPAGDVRDAEYAVAILTEGRYSVLLRCRCTFCKGVLHEFTPAPGSVELNRYLFKTRRFFRGKNRLRP